jgi:pimeloyl-ACP methyl ester carboxylesterase
VKALNQLGVRNPVRIFHGADDQISEPEQTRRLHRVLHRSIVHLVPNAGHMVTYADSAGVAQAAAVLGGVASP